MTRLQTSHRRQSTSSTGTLPQPPLQQRGICVTAKSFTWALGSLSMGTRLLPTVSRGDGGGRTRRGIGRLRKDPR